MIRGNIFRRNWEARKTAQEIGPGLYPYNYCRVKANKGNRANLHDAGYETKKELEGEPTGAISLIGKAKKVLMFGQIL